MDLTGSPTLLSFDDATTLFHEFGHAHHGMLSDVEFKRLAGTNVLTDFVELPSPSTAVHLNEQHAPLAALSSTITAFTPRYAPVALLTQRSRVADDALRRCFSRAWEGDHPRPPR